MCESWTRPLQLGVFHVSVKRGIDWEYGDQDGGEPAIGTVLKPDAEIIEDWLVGGITGTVGGPFDSKDGMHTGGWWVNRSACVQWQDGSLRYYRCGDVGYYDLDEILKETIVVKVVSDNSNKQSSSSSRVSRMVSLGSWLVCAV